MCSITPVDADVEAPVPDVLELLPLLAQHPPPLRPLPQSDALPPDDHPVRGQDLRAHLLDAHGLALAQHPELPEALLVVVGAVEGGGAAVADAGEEVEEELVVLVVVSGDGLLGPHCEEEVLLGAPVVEVEEEGDLAEEHFSVAEAQLEVGGRDEGREEAGGGRVDPPDDLLSGRHHGLLVQLQEHRRHLQVVGLRVGNHQHIIYVTSRRAVRAQTHYSFTMKRKEVAKKAELDSPKVAAPALAVKSPRKTQPPSAQRAPVSPLMALDASEEDVSSHEKEQFLLLQIKQLKRENNFLKKKISELTMQFGPERVAKKGREAKGAGSSNLEIMPLSINLFFEEIHNLLSTIVKLFRVSFSEEEVAAHQEKYSDELMETCPVRRHVLLKKYYLKRKLERIMLEDEERRFPPFLDLFTEYYQYKEESDSKIIETVDKMTLRAHELNDIVIRKVQEKKKSRSTYSMVRPEDEPLMEPLLRVPVSPKNYVANSKVATYSPANRKKKGGKFTMSPAERGRAGHE